MIKKQLTEGVTQRRVGLVSTGAPPRAHSLILNQEGKEVRASPETEKVLFIQQIQPAGPVARWLAASKVATHPQSMPKILCAVVLSDVRTPILMRGRGSGHTCCCVYIST